MMAGHLSRLRASVLLAVRRKSSAEQKRLLTPTTPTASSQKRLSTLRLSRKRGRRRPNGERMHCCTRRPSAFVACVSQRPVKPCCVTSRVATRAVHIRDNVDLCDLNVNLDSTRMRGGELSKEHQPCHLWRRHDDNNNKNGVLASARRRIGILFAIAEKM